jgi:hypothetical protein
MPARKVRVRLSRAERFEQADLSRSLRHRDQHDVHNPDASNPKRHRADNSKQKVQSRAELHDLGRIGNRIPARNGLVVLRIEVVPAGENGAHCLQRLDVKLWRTGLEA